MIAKDCVFFILALKDSVLKLSVHKQRLKKVKNIQIVNELGIVEGNKWSYIVLRERYYKL